MAEQPDNPLPADPTFSPQLEAELYALVDSLLDDSIDPVRLKRLETLVIEHRAAAVLYYELVHQWCLLPFHLSRGIIDLAKSEETAGFPTAAMDESMVLPAIAHGDLETGEDPSESAPPIRPLAPRRPAPAKFFRRWMGGTAAAAAILIGISYGWYAWHRPAELVVTAPSSKVSSAPVNPPVVATAPVPVPPAVLTATAGAQFDEDASIKPGTPLQDGDQIQLSDGAVEVTFASSAVVVVRGPARVRIIDRNALALIAGAISAHVPTSAHGFRVDSPGSSVVDLGTDFGVRSPLGSQRSEVDVFKGSVTAAPLDATGRALAAPVRVETDQAVQLNVNDPAPRPITFVPAAFDRDINAIRLPIRFHGTGVGIAPGAPDPNWQVLSVPGDPTWQPRPAVVLSNLWHLYAPNTPDGSWISISDPQQDVANGEYVFRTSVELTDVVPSTLSVQVRFAVDNQITDLRVNGVSTGVSTLKLKADDDFAGYLLTLPKTVWRAGSNQIDVVLLNNSFDKSDKPSFMGLQASWSASVSPVVYR